MIARRRLPTRRYSENFNTEFHGPKYAVTFTRFDDGTLAEVFVSNHKAGNASDVAARDAGILLSFCLQHGVAAQTIARALSRNSDGSAGGLMAAVLDEITEGWS